MFSNFRNKLVVRNYVLTVASVIFTSVGIADQFHNPTRLAHQERLNSFTRYLGAGVVTYSQRTFSR
jgi:hypothetical protein